MSGGNDDEIDIKLLAEAHAEKQKRIKKPKSVSKSNSLTAWMKLKSKMQEEEAWRQRLAKVWKKK